GRQFQGRASRPLDGRRSSGARAPGRVGQRGRISSLVLTMHAVRLRLYHHADGARVAYRELGAGPALALFHSALLSHREWEPAVEQLADRFRVVLPDLALHGDSEQRPVHPYTPDWFAEVLAGFSAEVLGPAPLVAGHDVGAEMLLHATLSGR